MIHDQGLVDRLSGFATERFDGLVYRATRRSADPTAPSINGGRWAPGSNGNQGIFALYTSLERDGAMAEIVSFLADLTPIPRAHPIKVTTLAVTTSKTLRLNQEDLKSLEIDPAWYGIRDYARTQQIGSALAFLGLDGLIAPSARWSCDNLVIFSDNHRLSEKLEPVGEEEIEWRSWAKQSMSLPQLIDD